MKRKTIVIKYGSSSVADKDGMDKVRLERYCADIAKVMGVYNIILVSSGSVAEGKALWFHKRSGQDDIDARTLAMIGSASAFTTWQSVLKNHGIISGQLLVTHREVDDPTEGPSVRAALEGNLKAGIISIVNENDALSDTELAKLSYGGDNDGLAAHIAVTIKASALLLMTDQMGLLSKEGLVKRIEANAEEWLAAKDHITLDISLVGRGGMLSKVEAAIMAARNGIDVHIASADHSFEGVIAGRSGTHFVALAK